MPAEVYALYTVSFVGSDPSSAVDAVEPGNARHLASARSGLLEVGGEPAYDDLVMLAAHIFRTPIAVISFTGAEDQWFTAPLGLYADPSPHDSCLRERAMLTGQFFTIDDAASHPDFAGSPEVHGKPFVRFYAGTPLFSDAGIAIGTLSVMDVVPRLIGPAERALLEALGRQVEQLLSLRMSVQTMLHDSSIAHSDLVHNQTRLLDVLDTITQGVVVHASDGSIQQANPAAERILGLSVDQMRGRTPIDPRWQTIHRDGSPFPGSEHPASITLRDGITVSDVTMGVAHPSGCRRWVLVTSTPIPSATGHGNGVLATFSDVTEMTVLNDQMTESLCKLTEAAQERAALLSSVSHDIRAPLASIRMMTEILEDRADAITGEQRFELIHRIRVEARRTEGVLADLVSANRVGIGLGTPRRQRVDLDELLTVAVREFANDDHVVCLGELSGDLWLWADRAQLERILDNLISNAIRHTPAGSTVVIGAVEYDDAVELSVEDNGPGIADNEKTTAFDPYVRGARSADRPGTGLGLYLVQQFAQFHGGRAWCEDAPGGGARVVVRLPLRSDAQPGR